MMKRLMLLVLVVLASCGGGGKAALAAAVPLPLIRPRLVSPVLAPLWRPMLKAPLFAIKFGNPGGGGAAACAPAGAAGEVLQSNGAGACQSEPAFAYDPATNKLTVELVKLSTGNVTLYSTGNVLRLREDSGGAGAAASIRAGQGAAGFNGGGLTLLGGYGDAGVATNSGAFTAGGSLNLAGGSLTFQAGNAISGNNAGGIITLTAGTSTGTGAGGLINITAGAATGTGASGGITLSTSAVGTPGEIAFQPGAGARVSSTAALKVTGAAEADPTTANACSYGGGSGAAVIVCEGSTADAFETTLAVGNPVADQTITFQENAAGTATSFGSSLGSFEFAPGGGGAPGALAVDVIASQVIIKATWGFGFSASLITAADAFWMREGAANIQQGLDAGTATAQSYKGPDSTTSGVAGASLKLAGGDGTVGNANGGDLIVSGGANAGTGVVGGIDHNAGWIKNQQGEASLNGNYTNATASFTSTALSITVVSGQTYRVQASIFLNDTIAADGARIDFNGGAATATNFRMRCILVDSTATVQDSTEVTALATAFAKATLSGTGQHEWGCRGTFVPSSSGTFIMRGSKNSNTTGTLTFNRGSWLSVVNSRPL